MADLNDDYIKKFTNEASLLADKNYIVGLLKEIHAEYKKVAKLKIEISGSTSSPKIVKDAKDLDATLSNTKKKTQELSTASTILSISQEEVSRAMRAEEIQARKTGTAINDLQKAEIDAIFAAKEYYEEKKRVAGASNEIVAAAKKESVSIEEAAIALTNNRVALDANLKSQKALKAALNEKDISGERRNKYTQQLSILVQEEQEFKNKIADSTRELKIQNQVIDSQEGTGKGLKAENRQLLLQRDASSNPAEIAAINEQIKENNRLLDQQKLKVDAVAKAVIPMSLAYKRGLDIIEKELADVNAQLAQGGLSPEKMAQLTARQQTLNNVLLNTGKQFSSTTTQANAFRQAGVQLGQVYGRNDPIFKSFNKEIGLGTLELNKTEKAVQRTASGSSALARGFRSVGASAVNLARLLPGIGIVGLIGGAVALIVAGFEKLTGAMSRSQKMVRANIESLEESKSAYTKATLEVKNLETAIDQARNGIITHEEALKLYNDTIGKTSGAVTTLDEAEQALAKNAEAYIRFTLLKAAANIALEKSAEKAFETEILNRKKDKSFSGFVDNITGLFGQKNERGSQAAADEFQANLQKAGLKKKTILVNQSNQEKLDLEAVSKKLFDEAKVIADKFNFDFNGIKPPGGGGGAKKKDKAAKEIDDESAEIVAAYEARLQSFLEAQQLILKSEADTQLRIFNNEKKSYNERADALLLYKKKEQEIIDNQNLQAESKLKSEEAKRLAKAKTAPLKEAVKAEFAAKFDLQKVKYAQETNKLVLEVDDLGTKLILENREKIDKANKKAFDDFIKSLEKFAEIDQVKALNGQLDKLKQLDKDFASGKIKSLEDYQARKEALLKEFDKTELQAQIDLELKKLSLAVFTGQDHVDIQKKIILLKKQQYDLDVKNFEEGEKEKIQKAKDIAKKIGEAIRAGGEFARNIVQNLYEREKDALQSLGNEIDRRRDRELAANEAIVQSQAERERKANIINAKAVADKAALDRRQKALDMSKARMDRAIAIAEVISNTAKAVTADLKGKKFLIPYDLAIGAMQLGAILSRPLPRFKHGLNKDYEGPGIVGDGGKREVKISKDGSFKITPNVDTLEYFEKGDRVHPDADQFMREFHSNTNKDIKKGQPAPKQDNTNRLIAKELGKQNTLLNKIANKKELEINGTGAGYESLWKIGSNRVRYINDKTNWK